MADQTLFFKQFDFSPVTIRGKECFQGSDGAYYSLKENEIHFTICRSGEESDELKPLFILERLLPPEEMEAALQDAFGSYLKDPDGFMKKYDSYETVTDLVRSCVGKKMEPKELENLCDVYMYAVKKGIPANDLASACRELFHIMQLRSKQYVSDSLHDRLLKVPDLYYDFLFGVENVCRNEPDLQERLYRYVTEHPEATTSDIIVYVSVLIGSPAAREESLCKILDHFHNEKGFHILKEDRYLGETLIRLDDHEWQLTSVTVGNNSYQFRQGRSICFVDYLNRCIGGSILKTWGEDTALLYDFSLQDEFKNRGIEGALIRHMEVVAGNSGKKRMVTFCLKDSEAAFRKAGFVPSETVENMLEKEIIWG